LIEANALEDKQSPQWHHVILDIFYPSCYLLTYWVGYRTVTVQAKTKQPHGHYCHCATATIISSADWQQCTYRT